MRPRLPLLALLTSIAAIALASSGLPGCGKEQSCVKWSESRGACPGPEAAQVMMTPRCDQVEVESVDSEGTFEDDACCYDVTKNDSAFYVCASPSPAGGSDGGCLTCGQWLNDPTATFEDVCSSSIIFYDSLADCVCLTGCSNECFSTACSGVAGPATCSACVETSCAAQLNNCASDL